jgi:hypothetical protein
MSFRIWHICGVCAPILFAGILARILFTPNLIAEVVGIVCVVVLSVLCVYGAYLGLRSIRGPILMKCPFCRGSGRLGYAKKDGAYLICDHCGLVHGVGPLKAKLICEPVRDEEEA